MRKIMRVIFISFVLVATSACSLASSANPASFKASVTTQTIPPIPWLSRVEEGKNQKKKKEKEPKEYLQWNSARLIESENVASGTDLFFLAEFENVSSTPVAIYNLDVELIDSDDEVLKKQSLAIYPYILEPKQKGYVCELVVNSLIDTDVTSDQVDALNPEGVLAPLTPLNSRKTPDIELSKPAFNQKFERPNFVCEVINHEANKVGPVNVVCPVYSAEGELLTVIVNNIKKLKAGESETINQMPVIYDEEGNYNGATIAPFLYTNEVLR